MSTSVPGWPHRPNPLEQELVEEREREVERGLHRVERQHEAEEAVAPGACRRWPFFRRRKH
jgi:hypothetical protein